MNILFVADDLSTLESIEQHIRSLGYDVTACGDAETALEAYQHTFYPLIVLDLGLPEMDGVAFCRRIRALPQGDQSLILV